MKIYTAPFFLVLLWLFPQNPCVGQHHATKKATMQSQAALNAALLKAADSGDLENVKALLTQGADVNARDTEQRTPLILAAQADEAPIIRVLLAHGAAINATDNDGNTPLHDAADEGFVQAAKLLLDKGANYRIKNHYGSTPLWLTGRGESPASPAENKAIAKSIRQRMAYDKRHKHDGAKRVNRV